MPVQPYVNFDGNCREAVTFYARVFETHPPEFMTFGEMPMDPDYAVSEDSKGLILHTSLDIAGSTVMFSDTFPGMPLDKGNNISLTVMTTDRDAIHRWFDGLKEGGVVEQEIRETFWSKAYGALKDKYGVYWMLSLEES